MTAASRQESRVQFDREKLIEAVYEIIAYCKDEPERLGINRLHRTLYYVDMLAYLDRSKPVTGVEYVKESFGPAARYLPWAITELQRRDAITVNVTKYYGLPKVDFGLAHNEHRPMNKLIPYERELIEIVAEWVCGFDAKDISEIEARKPWVSVGFGEPIPYGGALLLLPERRPTKRDLESAHRRVSGMA